MSPKHQMSPKYLAGQKVDTARFGFPEVTGGWGSLQCSALDQRVCELTVSSFFILKNGQIPSTGFEKGSTVCKVLNFTRMMTMGHGREGKKTNVGPRGPGGGDGNGRLRPERRADKEGDENEGS